MTVSESTSAFGIDLGTTNSCIAHVDDAGRPVVVKNAIGEDTTPSVVYFQSRTEVVVGKAARGAAVLAPHQVAQLVKRQMGSDAEYTYQQVRHTPESISALILRELAETAAERTGRPVREVVITVPAYFGIGEREATRRAGRIAGLEVLDVVPEPVAAALSYVGDRTVDGTRHLLVYDLGGGTFDTSVIRLSGRDVQAVCTDGDHELGGADLDREVAGLLLAEFVRQHPGLDPAADDRFRYELGETAERMRTALTSSLTQHANLRFGGAVARVTLTRERLEELAACLLERTLVITERAIATARAKGVTELDEVVLVGGLTKMPAVRERLAERLGLPVRSHEPDLAVARGAALYASLSGRAEGTERSGVPGAAREETEPPERTVAGVVPRAFGIRTLDRGDPLAHTEPHRARNIVVHLLPAGTELPAGTGPVPFAIAVPNAPMVDLEVWEERVPDASEDLEDNRLVGRGRLLKLPPGLPKNSRIDVSFQLGATGLLTVRAVELSSGREVSFDLRIGGMDAAAEDTARGSVSGYTVTS